MRYTDPINSRITRQVRTSSGWGIAIGVILLILGFVAIARPLYATIASIWVFGWLFIAAGIAQTIFALRWQGIGQLTWKLLLGMVYLIAGIYIVSNLMSGAIALTLVLGITIFAQGVIEVILAFQMRPAQSWSLVLLAGIVGIILGIFIWSRFPYNADWLIGLWVGLHLLFTGSWILVVSSVLRAAFR